MKFLIAGLGNIGDDYLNTRHNIGFVVADALAQSLKCTFTSGRYASSTKGKLKGRSVTIIKPNTYMNLSGKAIRYWMRKEKIEPENTLVVIDDLALPLGALRLRKQGSDGGHNGLISIIEILQTTGFPRLRVGIGNDFARGRQVDYVLGQWTGAEEKILIPRIEQAVEAIQYYILQGIDKAMNLYN